MTNGATRARALTRIAILMPDYVLQVTATYAVVFDTRNAHGIQATVDALALLIARIDHGLTVTCIEHEQVVKEVPMGR